MSINSKDVSIFRKRRKNDLIRLLGGKCQICGFDSFPDAQEFHHTDPATKEHGQSNGRTRALNRDITEVKKCVLLCSNCHRGVHAGFYECPKKNSYSYDIEKELLLSIGKRSSRTTKNAMYCGLCGKVIYSKAKLCRSCFLDTTRSVKPTREQQKDQIRIKPFAVLAKEHSVSNKTISNWCRAYCLPYKKSDIRSISDDDWINI